MYILFVPLIPLVHICLHTMQTSVHQNTCTKMVTEELFITAYRKNNANDHKTYNA